jgi:hypothetical protein
MDGQVEQVVLGRRQNGVVAPIALRRITGGIVGGKDVLGKGGQAGGQEKKRPFMLKRRYPLIFFAAVFHFR